jgi:Zn-dependent protease
MFIELLFREPWLFVFFLATIVAAVTVHEAAHALVADRLGDPTARLLGRISLNPSRHLDPLGSIFFLFVGFGWGKPVPVDSFNLREPIKDNALIALAGPLSNVLMAGIAGGIYRLSQGTLPQIGAIGLELFAFINVGLAVFNLLPIPPLDGSKIYRVILPEVFAPVWEFLDRYGFYVLLIIFLAGNKLIHSVTNPMMNNLLNLLGFGNSFF